jgi:membrane-bound lytic murein transglycosylase D
MTNKRLLKVAPLALGFLLSSGCAHQNTKTQVDVTSNSLGLPLRSEGVDQSTDQGFKPILQHKLPQLQLPQVQIIPQTLPQKKYAVSLIRPQTIRMPSAKDDNIETDLLDASLDTPLVFDIPVAYNSRVKYWIEFFQTSGRGWFTKWLERSSRYLPLLQKTLKRNGLPQDLAYMAMIESGFSSQASSTAQAVGPWQFIRETGSRYGLHVTWWLDERRDFQKSTEAASHYLKKMYGMFHNWYLVAAGYNTGENRIARAIQKHKTKNFWKIASHDLEAETRDYVPKLMAALLISKAPEMYGFHHINYNEPLQFERFRVPGGTRLEHLATAIGVSTKSMLELNPELVRGYVPDYVEGHWIRIPKGSTQLISHYIRKTFVSQR